MQAVVGSVPFVAGSTVIGALVHSHYGKAVQPSLTVTGEHTSAAPAIGAVFDWHLPSWVTGGVGSTPAVPFVIGSVLFEAGSPLIHWQAWSTTQVVSSLMLLVHFVKSAALSGMTFGTQKSLSSMNSFPVDHWHLAWLQASLVAAVMHCPIC